MMPLLHIIYTLIGFAIFQEKGNGNKDNENLEDKTFMQIKISNE
ncbi:hypothetical protein [Peribacillus aracenensis]|nr:hypothetical protein [Peribacillus sp. BBB004]